MSGFANEGAPAGCSPAGASSFAWGAANNNTSMLDGFVSRGATLGKATTPRCSPVMKFVRTVSGASTECSPMMKFVRTVSGASTEPLEHDDYDGYISDNFDEQPLPPLPSAGEGLEQALEDSLAEVKELFRARFGEEVDDSSEDEQEELRDEEGTLWFKTVGKGPLTIEVLEGKLAEVKDLYRSVYGQGVDFENENEASEDHKYDSDGTLWLKTLGSGPLNLDVLQERLDEVKALYQARYGDEKVSYDEEGTPWIETTGTGPLTVVVLEESLVEVKDLYRDAFGHDVDSEFDENEIEYDAEGTAWIKTVGSGPLSVSVLEDRLLEVKALYRIKYSRDIDGESDGEEQDMEYDEEGTAWIKTVGTGPLTIDALEKSLAEAKELYCNAFGHGVDSESEDQYEYDADGTAWAKTVGHGPLTVAALEDQLAEVKALFESKYGFDVDDKSMEYQDFEYDEDGTPWIKTTGTGPLTIDVLEERLAEVRSLYLDAFSHDIDSDSDEEFEYDTEGTAWTKTVGSGPLTVSVLEEQLLEVKALYRTKYGQDCDGESAEEDQNYTYDEDGASWIKTVGTGPLTVDALEKSLAEVKDLYCSAFGSDVDSESEEQYVYDADGTAWVKTVGHGPLTVAALEYQLAEVKALFESKYGFDVDDKSMEYQDVEYDEDGTPWIKTTGTGPLTLEVLEERLAEVRSLYLDVFGRDTDSDSNEEFEYDVDGTPWTKTVGSGPLTVSILEEQLLEVKTLYRIKFGQDFDEESAGEGQDIEYDEEGTAWIQTVGTGPLTVDTLERSLAEVKELYWSAFGSDADAEEEEYEYDADGTAWVKTVGTGPLTISALEDQLAEVKALFQKRYSGEVDDEAVDEDQAVEYDKDGTLWIKIVGTGPVTVSVLEERLAEVQQLYKDAFGHDIDSDSDEDELEHDAEGTAWIRVVGSGPLTVSLLEKQLQEVKTLYEVKYGQNLDEQPVGEQDVEYDVDGTAWIKTVGTGLCIQEDDNLA